MAIDKELKGYARDCIRLARLTDDPTIRGPFLKMAREWLEAAAASYPRRVTRVARVRSSASKRRHLGGGRAGPPKARRPGDEGRPSLQR